MNEPIDQSSDQPSRAEMMAAIFANMILQQANMAMMFLGQVPHPETGETVRDLEAARMFIDQLEMLEVKTKGNLDKREEALLKQSLMHTRMAFVETIESKGAAPAPAPTPAAVEEKMAAAPAPETPPTAAPEAAAVEAEAESRKKFSKKY